MSDNTPTYKPFIDIGRAMSDNTLTVYEKCKHGRLDFHYFHDYDPDHVCDNPTHVECQKNVCGGREIVLTLWGCVQYDGFNIVMDGKEWDVALYTMEVTDE